MKNSENCLINWLIGLFVLKKNLNVKVIKIVLNFLILIIEVLLIMLLGGGMMLI